MRLCARCMLLSGCLFPFAGMSECSVIPCLPSNPDFDPVTGLCTTMPVGNAVPFGPAGTGTGGLPSEPDTEFPADSEADPDNVNLDIFGLNGRWTDNGREVCIQHFGASVHAWYLELYECDHRDGTNGSSSTETDFRGDVVDRVVTGEITVCRFGHESDNGVRFTAFTATVSEDGKTIDGTWFNSDLNTDVPVTITRISVGNCSRGSF